LFLVLALLLSLFAVGPLLQPGYFWGAHDARHNVYFLWEWDHSFREGIWWPRWAPDFCFGYGYPFFNIYGPLGTMVAEGFHLLGLDYVGAVKAVFGLAFVLSALAMYGFGRRLWGPRGGMLASVAYTYAPYHILDAYVRAALPESLSFVLIPLVFWGFYEAIDRPRVLAVLWSAAAFGALLLTSQLVALVISLVLAVYLVALVLRQVLRDQPLSRWSRESVWPFVGNLVRVSTPPLVGLLLGVGLSGIFTLPMAAEFQYVRTDQWYAGRYDFRDDFIYPFQLLGNQWGFGTSVPGPDDDVSFQLGMAPLALGAIGLGRALKRRGRGWRQAVFFGAVVLGSAFLMSWFSAPLWEALSPIRFAQFPWRYQILVVPALALLVGSLGTSEDHNRSGDQRPALAVALLLSLLLIMGSYPYLRAEIHEPKEGPVSLASLMRFQQWSDEMTGATIWTKEIPRWSPMADLHVAGQPVETLVDYTRVPPGGVLGIHSLEISSIHEKLWVYAADGEQEVHFYRFYYPGWRAYVLDENTEEVLAEAPIGTAGAEGHMWVPVPEGRHILLLRFEDTPVRVLGKVVSGVSILLAMALTAVGAWVRRGGRRG
jgi:hypothetical protein